VIRLSPDQYDRLEEWLSDDEDFFEVRDDLLDLVVRVDPMDDPNNWPAFADSHFFPDWLQYYGTDGLLSSTVGYYMPQFIDAIYNLSPLFLTPLSGATEFTREPAKVRIFADDPGGPMKEIPAIPQELRTTALDAQLFTDRRFTARAACESRLEMGVDKYGMSWCEVDLKADLIEELLDGINYCAMGRERAAIATADAKGLDVFVLRQTIETLTTAQDVLSQLVEDVLGEVLSFEGPTSNEWVKAQKPAISLREAVAEAIADPNRVTHFEDERSVPLFRVGK
jgi:hypothetical protein